MRVLSLHQPWATLVAIGVKTIETRSWKAPASLIGERIAVHAAVRPPDVSHVGDYWTSRRVLGDWEIWRAGQPLTDMPLGRIVATARIAACLQMVRSEVADRDARQLHLIGDRIFDATTTHFYVTADNCVEMSEQVPYGDFGPGRWAWLLDDVQPLAEPVPFRGGQGLSRSWEP